MAESQIQGEASLPDTTLVEDPGSGEKLAAFKRKWKPRPHRTIVESMHIRTMVASYLHHLTIYSKDREQVNQIIPSTVWKAVYAHYLKQFPNSPFVEETLKDRLREAVKEMQSGKYVEEEEAEKVALQSDEVVARLKDRLRETLKELRMATFTEEEFEKAVLQSDELLQADLEKVPLNTPLKAYEENATRNVLKRKLSSIDGAVPPVPSRNLLKGNVAPLSYCMPSSLAPSAVTFAPRNSVGACGVAPIAYFIPGSFPPSAATFAPPRNSLEASDVAPISYSMPGSLPPSAATFAPPRNSLEASGVAPASNCMQPGSLPPSAAAFAPPRNSLEASGVAPASNCMQPGSLPPSAAAFAPPRNSLEASGVAPASNCMQPGSLAPPSAATFAPRNSLEASGVAPASNCMQPGSVAPSATSGPSSSPVEKVMAKAEMLLQQSRSIAAIATQYQSTFEKRDALIAAEMDCHRAKSDYYNEKRRKLKIGNLKLLKDSGVISEEDFKQQVKLV